MARAAALLAAVLVTGSAQAQTAINPIHPSFKPLAHDGNTALSAAEVSADVTCGACHDAAYIRGHDSHAAARSSATCIDCHVDLQVSWTELDREGLLPRQALRIGTPRAARCAPCHGLIVAPEQAVVLPAKLAMPVSTGRSASLTLGEGAIVSAEHVNGSFLNLEGKASLTSPWDVHAAKLVDCVACHHARNNPARVDVKKEKLDYVYADPRRSSTADFLTRPDHRLVKLDCRSCHDASKAHSFLPYRARHMDRLACQVCHIQAPLGPAAEMIDETVVSADGQPLVRYRNRDNTPGVAANAAWIAPLRPLLVLRDSVDGTPRLTPVNLVAHWRWRSPTGPVPLETLARALLFGESYAPSILSALDRDRDGSLSPAELRLDAESKVAVVRDRLRALGVVDPKIAGEVEVHVLAHGVPARERAQRDCQACHSDAPSFGGDYAVAEYLPGGVAPPLPNLAGFRFSDSWKRTPAGGLVLSRAGSDPLPGFHVLGLTRSAWSNWIGFAIFLAVALALVAHALVRVIMRARRGPRALPPAQPAGREYVFGRYERFWHWTMACSGIVLIVTGLLIHTGAGAAVGLASVVWWHNAAAIALMTNAFLGFFYHSVTAAIRHFIPESKGLLRRVFEHADYQARGIFYDGPHPRNAPGSKLNPLQQLTYLALLNFLFPLQIATGIIMWAVGQWPPLSDTIGALASVAPIHNLGAWLFLTFFVLHVYLVTTGRTVTEHLQTMITGYRDAEPEARAASEPSVPPNASKTRDTQGA